MRKDINGMVIYIVAILFVLSDRLLKFFAVKRFFSPDFDFLGGLFRIHFVPNYNIAFSLSLMNGPFLNIIIGLIILVLGWLMVYNHFRGKILNALALSFMVLGALSNLYDRLSLGYVVDYFDLKYFTVFNLSDCLIVVGALMLLAMNLKSEKPVTPAS